MKKITFILILSSLVFGCQKEEIDPVSASVTVYDTSGVVIDTIVNIDSLNHHWDGPVFYFLSPQLSNLDYRDSLDINIINATTGDTLYTQSELGRFDVTNTVYLDYGDDANNFLPIYNFDESHVYELCIDFHSIDPSTQFTDWGWFSFMVDKDGVVPNGYQGLPGVRVQVPTNGCHQPAIFE